ncbi:hypothetical protein HDU92_007458 [Lobulomyces angularis]|nr:hypothetical protein HDU92_007458 [Lobulomyces angularis]
MNFDKKRILGPDGSIEPPYEIKSEKLNINNREFNRESKQLRPLCMRIDTIKQANGSAYVELGDLKVVCAVYGPRQSLKPGNSSAGSLNCDFKFAPFSCKKRRPYPKDTQEKEYGLLLNQALVPSLRLDLLPKSVIDIYVQVLEADGMVSSLAAAVTCASLALANAGIEMYDFVSGASAGYVDNSIILDCDLSEEEKINFNGSIFLSYMPASNEVTHIVQWGEVNYANSAKAIEICVDACSQIHSVMSQTLLNSIKD